MPDINTLTLAGMAAFLGLSMMGFAWTALRRDDGVGLIAGLIVGVVVLGSLDYMRVNVQLAEFDADCDGYVVVDGFYAHCWPKRFTATGTVEFDIDGEYLRAIEDAKRNVREAEQRLLETLRQTKPWLFDDGKPGEWL